MKTWHLIRLIWHSCGRSSRQGNILRTFYDQKFRSGIGRSMARLLATYASLNKYLDSPSVERTLVEVLSTHFPRDIARNMMASK